MRTWRHRRAGVLTGLIFMSLMSSCAPAQEAAQQASK